MNVKPMMNPVGLLFIFTYSLIPCKSSIHVGNYSTYTIYGYFGKGNNHKGLYISACLTQEEAARSMHLAEIAMQGKDT